MAAQGLTAQLGLNISAFTAALHQAQQQFQQFATQVTQALHSSTAAITQQTQSQQASQQSTNQLAAAYLAMAQAIHAQTNAYAQAQAAALQFRQQQAAAAAATRQAAQQAQAANQIWQQMFAVAGGLGLVTSIQGIIAALKNFATESVNVAVKMQSLESAFRAISGGAHGAANVLSFLRETAQRVGVDFLTTAQAFRNFESATRGTALEGQKANDVFVSMVEASRVIGLSSAELGRVLLALEQIVSKGKVSMEELRRQLGNALPGAFQIAARAMGTTTQGLNDLVKAGLDGTEFVEKFGAQVRREFGQGVPEAAKTAQASFARFANNVRDLSQTVGDSILRFLQPLVDKFNELAEASRRIRGARAEAREDRVRDVLRGTSVRLDDLTPQEREDIANLTGDLGERSALSFFSFRSGTQQAQDIVARAGQRAQRAAVSARQMEEAAGEGTSLAPGTAPFTKQLAEATRLYKEMKEEIAGVNAQAKLFPGQVDIANEKLKIVEKTQKQIREMVGETPGLYERIPPALQAIIGPMRDQGALFKKQVEDADAASKAQKQAAHEAEQQARERARIVESMRDKAIDASQDEFEARRQHLDNEVKAYLDAGGKETDIAENVAQIREKIAKDEADARIEELRKGTKAYFAALDDQLAVAQRIEEEITTLTSKETKSRVDDFLASMAKKREAYIKEGALASDIVRLETAIQSRARDIRADEAAKEAKKLQKAYEDLVEGIAKPIQSIFENIVSGTGNLLDTLKQMFFRFLAEIAARAIATQVVIPVLMQVAGGGGTFAGVASGIIGAASGTSGAGYAGAGGAGSGANWFGYAQQGYSVASTGSTLMGGPSASSLFGLGSMTLGDLGIGSVGASGAAGYTGLGFEAGFGTGQSGTAALAGTTVGSVVSGVGAGLSVALIVNELNKLVGLSGGGIKGAAGGALAGAAGGAVLGSIVPVIGTAIGAIVGAALGAILGGLLGGGGKQPSLDIQYAQAGMAGYNADLGGLYMTQPFQLGQVTSTMIPTKGKINAVNFLNDTINDMFGQVINGFKGLSPLLQQAVVGQLNASADEFRQYLMQGPKIEGEDIKEALEKFVTKTLPNYFKDAFGKLEGAVKKLDPYVRAYEKVINDSTQVIAALSRQQAQAHLGLAQTIVGIQEGLFSPAQQFMARQQDLRAAMGLLQSATPQQKIALIPQIQDLAKQIFNLGVSRDVLGQDPQAVRNLQKELLDLLASLGGEIDTSFGSMKTDVQQQVDLAQQQVDLLTGSLSNLDNIDTVLQQSLLVFQDIQAALAPFGVNAQQDAALQIQGSMLDVQVQQLQVLNSINASLAGAQGHQHGIAYVPMNQWSFLHAGERVVPAHENNANNGTIVINVHGGVDSNALVETIIRKIEQKGGRLQAGKIMVRN